LSRTDKTTPWKVRAATDPAHLAVPVHDHLGRECDLPASPDTLEVTTCSWRPSKTALFGAAHVDALNKFITPIKRARDRRTARHSLHLEEHTIMRATLVGINPDDIDKVH
jgi:hypothetical protein